MKERIGLWFNCDFSEVEGVRDSIGVVCEGLRLRVLGERGSIERLRVKVVLGEKERGSIER